MTQQEERRSVLEKIAAYTEILAKDPASTIFVSLAEAYRKMGMFDDARQIIEKSLDIHPDFSPAHVVLGRVFCQLGDYERSENFFQDALQHDQESLAALVGYARLNILLDREGKARELLIEARRLSPADSVINKLLLSLPEELLVPEADDASVETEPEIAEVEESPVALASSTLAELYLKQGLTQQALDIYRQLSEENPNNLDLRRQIRDLEENSEEDDREISVTTPVEDEVPQLTSDNSEGEANPDARELVDPQIESAENIPEAITSVLNMEAGKQSGDDKILASLNQWIENIRQRRGHV